MSTDESVREPAAAALADQPATEPAVVDTSAQARARRRGGARKATSSRVVRRRRRRSDPPVPAPVAPELPPAAPVPGLGGFDPMADTVERPRIVVPPEADDADLAASPPVVADEGTTGTDDAAGGPVAPDAGRVRFWHRDHPVFTPLAGFFTGLVLVLVVLIALGAILEALGWDVTADPWVFLVAIGVLVAVNLGLVAYPRTRRFARYMLFGVGVTPLVVVGVGALTLYVLLRRDG